MFSAFANLAASPNDPSVRTAALNAAGSFAQATGTLSTNLRQTADDQLTQVGAIVAQANNIAQSIAGLNSQIQGVKASSGSAAALLDQRDALVGELASLTGATGDASGNVVVNGVPLVSGTSALTLSTTGSGTGIGLQVSLANGALPLQTTQVGGQLGGIFAGAASTLQLRSDLNNFATSVATSINAVHAAGYGLDGSTGNQLFAIPGSAGAPIVLNPAITIQNLATSATAAGIPGDGSNANAIAVLACATGLDPSFPGDTLGQAFSTIAANFGTTVNNAAANETESTASVNSLDQLKGSITGVSLNGQLTNLVQYQNALEACGRAVQAANDMTNFLLQAITP
jgi:flagellar hook-associated protein 1 FlgK